MIPIALIILYLAVGYRVTLMVERQGGQWRTWPNRVVGTLIWPLVVLTLIIHGSRR